ncbi:MAG: methylmalonyl Co-A mutase-associated GTPase MeaB [Bryobacteraceae bacterium]|nr:methylmalonyl Co-A mutase-associated GTPase MeaB [Bryobacteraceae bacterium]MDW8378475.1 methylmalonyl Co-A mutase-associated GTPase MeaB [Bryobacterales bacterium]
MSDPVPSDCTRRRLTLQQYVDGVLSGDRVVLARAITLVESDLDSDQELAAELLDACLPHTGKSRRIGVAGAPGAGKSTFLDALGMHLITDRNERVAILSIDPSSPVSGGSILGDKTRMQRLAAQPQAFIRPSASRGRLGGVAPRTRECILLVEAAGFQNVLIETVGVGQSETALRTMTDFFLLLLIPGAGDELQGIKRGILEMADLVAINKADGDNRARALQAQRSYEFGLRLLGAPLNGWSPRVLTCSALTGENIPLIWDVVLEHEAQMTASGFRLARRRQQALDWLWARLQEQLEAEFRRHAAVQAAMPAVEQKVREGVWSPPHAARHLLQLFQGPESA